MDFSALEYVAPHCDIEERLRAAPPGAQVRGIAFRSITGALKESNKLEQYCERFGSIRYESLALYPLGEYLIRLASAAAFLHTPAGLYAGMAEISRNNAREMTASVLGQTLIHALASDPHNLIKQGLAMRRQTFDYGHWELFQHAPRHLEVRYFDEYVWIEQSHTFAAAGMFDACSIKPQIATKLDSMFSGSTHFQW